MGPASLTFTPYSEGDTSHINVKVSDIPRSYANDNSPCLPHPSEIPLYSRCAVEDIALFAEQNSAVPQHPPSPLKQITLTDNLRVR